MGFNVLYLDCCFTKILICRSSIIQDLKEELLDAPLEVSSGSRAQQMFSKQQKEKEEYEEAYLTRLPVTKAEKHRQRKLTTLGEFYCLIYVTCPRCYFMR